MAVERVEQGELEQPIFERGPIADVVALEVAVEIGAHSARELGEGGVVFGQAAHVGRYAVGVDGKLVPPVDAGPRRAGAAQAQGGQEPGAVSHAKHGITRLGVASRVETGYGRARK